MFRIKEFPIPVRVLIALLAAFAVAAVLISPAPDELPGTTPHFDLYAAVFTTFLLSAPQLVSLPGIGDGAQLQSPSLAVDLLTLECTRLC